MSNETTKTVCAKCSKHIIEHCTTGERKTLKGA
jgi:hypothetical protein